MRLVLFLVAMVLAAWADASPIAAKQQFINRPSSILRKSPLPPDNHTKGTPQVESKASQRPEMNLRKGEYMCGSKVCKLQPGMVPPGCDGLCQYPIA